jgi:hypothetical protein
MGQIHSSGLVLAASFFLWAFLFDRRRVAWLGWLAGNALAALPLIPWLLYTATSTEHAAVCHQSWKHAIEGKFWIRFATEPFGLGLDYALFEDFPAFLRFPTIAGHPTYLVGALHALVTGALIVLLTYTGVRLWRERRKSLSHLIGRTSDSAFTVAAILWGFGILLALSCMPTYRHYMVVLFPLEFLWLARLALAPASSKNDAPPAGCRPGRALLVGLFVAECLLTVSFLAYIHVHEGSRSGDYGVVYRHSGQRFRTAPEGQFHRPRPTVPMVRPVRR